MPRRALRKIDSSLDLSHYLEDVGRAAATVESIRTLRSGSAARESKSAAAKASFFRVPRPPRHTTIFSASRSPRSTLTTAPPASPSTSLPNAVMISGNAERVFRELLPDDSLAAVHVYFPDPWWKKRHHKRRVMNPDFVKDVTRTLMPGGRLHFWTDVEDYFNATLALLAEQKRARRPARSARTPRRSTISTFTPTSSAAPASPPSPSIAPNSKNQRASSWLFTVAVERRPPTITAGTVSTS